MPSRSPKKSKRLDPHAERESRAYGNPIASREFILEQLEQIGEPASFEQLCQRLDLVDADAQDALRRRLKAMARDGQVISNRRGVYGLAAHMDLLPGRVQGSKEGIGYFIPDDKSGDLFLNAREMERLFDGDRVLARLTGVDSRGRREGTVVEILQHRYTEIVGRYYRDHGFGILIPDNKRVPHEILVPNRLSGEAKDGQFVVAAIQEYPSARRKAIAAITEVLGDLTTPGLEIEVALRSHGIPHAWPGAVTRQSAGMPARVRDADHAHRFDLRDLPFVTIDGEDAKDFDDAVFAHRHQRGNWTLYVAIADVSHYVSPGSALDQEATLRGTSVYFPGHVVPMLPEKLSNGLCSLKPGEDRLAMVCEMELTAAGELGDFRFYEGLIHSHARLTYTEVADMVQPAASGEQEKLQARLRQRNAELVEHLDTLFSLYRALRSYREAKGALDFETTETRIVFGRNKKIREIVPVERNHAHRLIEECMLCANIAAAMLLEKYRLPALYRVHEGPNPDKLDNLREFLGELGLYLGGGDKPQPKHYQQVMQAMASRPDRHLLQTLLIRSMMQAVYQPENIGHFGLGFPAYTHFTSPIRRYPDLLVHRAIRFLLRNNKGAHLQKHPGAPSLSRQSTYPYDGKEMQRLGEDCSAAERRADAASWAVIGWLKCEYMQQHVGDDFIGTVSAVTSFGLFVELNDIFIEGLVHITELSNDYYHFDPVRHCLTGERRHNVYSLGDTVEVKVVRVDIDDKKIDLQMVGNHSSGGQPGKRRGKKAGGSTGTKARGKTAARKSKQATAAKPGGGGSTGTKARGKTSARKSKQATAAKPGGGGGSTGTKARGKTAATAKTARGKAAASRKRR